MRKFLTLAAVPMVAIFLSPVAWGQPKKGKDQVTVLDTTEQDYTALANYSGVTGKIMSLSPSNTSMTLRVEYQVMELKDNAKPPKFQPPPNFGKGSLTQGQIQNRLNKIQMMKNPIQQQQQLINLLNQIQNDMQRQQILQIQWVQKQMQQMANNYKSVTYAKEFDLNIVAQARVAKKSLGMEYDDKGNIKEYTPEELKKLRDTVYTDFFKSKMEEVTPGLTVYVVLAKPKPDKAKPKPDDKDKGQGEGDPKDKDKDKAKPGIDINDIFAKPAQKNDQPDPKKDPLKPMEPTKTTNTPVIQTILILSEVGINEQTPTPEPKKKKKANN
jgi:hypothetical protein